MLVEIHKKRGLVMPANTHSPMNIVRRKVVMHDPMLKNHFETTTLSFLDANGLSRFAVESF
jgi:hypothetical protein